jgi:Flp pilus assembly protein TadG
MAGLNVRRALAAFRRDVRGAEAVEFALVLPILMLVVAGIFDMGFLFNNYETLTNAAREGARLAVVPGMGENEVDTRVKQYLQADGMNPDAADIDVAPVQIDVGGAPINGVKVTVSYPYNYMVLGPIAGVLQGGGTFDVVNLTAASTMRIETAAGL